MMKQCAYLSYRWSIRLDLFLPAKEFLHNNALQRIYQVLLLQAFEKYATNQSKLLERSPHCPRVRMYIFIDK